MPPTNDLFWANRIVLVSAYGYEQASIKQFNDEEDLCQPYTLRINRVPREFVHGLEGHLAKLVNWPHTQNKSLFIFDYDNERFAVKFHDFHATFISWSWYNHDKTLPRNIVLSK